MHTVHSVDDGVLVNSFIKLVPPQDQNQIKSAQKEKLETTLMNIEVKILCKTLLNLIEQCTKKITHYDQVKFILEI